MTGYDDGAVNCTLDLFLRSICPWENVTCKLKTSSNWSFQEITPICDHRYEFYNTSQRRVVSARIPSDSPLGRTASTQGWDWYKDVVPGPKPQASVFHVNTWNRRDRWVIKERRKQMLACKVGQIGTNSFSRTLKLSTDFTSAVKTGPIR